MLRALRLPSSLFLKGMALQGSRSLKCEAFSAHPCSAPYTAISALWFPDFGRTILYRPCQASCGDLAIHELKGALW